MTEPQVTKLPPHVKDISGKKYGKMTVLKFVTIKGDSALWECACDCGRIKVVIGSNLRRGHTRSCGCILVENVKARSTHGHKAGKSPFRQMFQAYHHMKVRTKENGDPRYKDWWGRGIKNLWGSYEEFRKDMQDTFRPGLTLERIDNNGHYCKENCKWATHKEQSRNRRCTIFVFYKGERIPLGALVERLGLKYTVVKARYSRGSSIEEAMCPTLFRAHCL